MTLLHFRLTHLLGARIDPRDLLNAFVDLFMEGHVTFYMFNVRIHYDIQVSVKHCFFKRIDLGFIFV